MTAILSRMTGPLLCGWALAGIVLTLAAAWCYLVWGGFGEQGMVTFSAVSWLLAQDYPLYTALDAADRYSLQHGPLIYLIISGFMKVFGPSCFSAKLPGLIFFALTILVSGFWIVKKNSFKQAMFILGVECWALSHWHYKYYSRPDAVLLFMLAFCMFLLVTRGRYLLQLMVLAFFCGLSVNLKAHSILYFVPVMAVLYEKEKFGARNWITAACVGAATAVAPFLHSAISLENYLLWITASFSHEYTLKNFIPKLISMTILWLIPLCTAIIAKKDIRDFFKVHRPFLSTLFVAMLIVSVVASKSGSGTNHLIPFVPLISYLLFLIIQSPSVESEEIVQSKSTWTYGLLLLLLLSMTISGIGKERAIFSKMSEPEYREMLQEYQQIERDYHGKTLAIVEGEMRRKLPYRDLVALPVFRGNPLLLDSVALGDMQSAGFSLPQKTVQALAQGRIQVWLIPKGQQPFAGSAYHEQLQDLFYKNYSFAEQRGYFDIWLYHE